jgi:hypothetical protein
MSTYSISRRTNKLLSLLLDLTILNSLIAHTSFCSKLSHQQSTVQVDTGEGPNTTGRQGVSTKDHEIRKTSPTHQTTKKT